MAVRKIILYAEHKLALRERSKTVPLINQKVLQLIRDLKDSLEAHSDGVGLAAPQINIHKRVVVVCPGDDVSGKWQAGPPVALVNPEIVEASDERRDFDGCLSFPGLFGETTRPHYLRVTGLDEDGKPFDRVYEGFNAVVIHHEIDHLDGVLFIDRIESLRDLYTIRENERGEMVRMPVTE
ncbi:MAG: peptide deformylase [Anaerolineales bacterium]|nr:peptide deformylase [Anaerolineales bacterium]